MAGGCLSCFLASTSVLLLGGCLYGVEASRCDRVINKKVGDTVELASCAPTEGVTLPEWRFGSKLTIAGTTVHGNNQFEGRLELNPTSFDLTVRELTRQDSGVFQFNSDVNNTQAATVTITLTVHASPLSVAVLGAAGGACLMVVVAAVVAVCVCKRKQGPGAGGDTGDNTLYADITDVAIRGGTSSTIEPCTVYETIGDKGDPVTLPQTVYDKIQLNRMRKPSVSPYQEVS